MMKEPSRLICGLMLVLLHFAIVFPLINIPAIGGSSEAREAHVVKVISVSREWLLPTRNGLIPSKPPLFHWVGATLSHMGLNPLKAARTTSAIFGSGVLLLTFLLAGALVRSNHGSNEQGKTTAGFFALVVLSTILMFEHMYGEARVDMAFAMFSTLALFCLVKFPSKNQADIFHLKNNSWHFPIFFVACGFAILSRGPAALPFVLALAFAVLSWLGGFKFGVRAICKPRWSWLVLIGIALPWYCLAFSHGGDPFLSKQVAFEIFQRITGGEHIKSGPFWFYIPSFTLRTLPWILFVLMFVASDAIAILKLRNVLSSREIYFRRISLSPMVWVVSGLILISLVSGKRHSYVLPLLPPMAAYLGARFQQWFCELSAIRKRLSVGLIKKSHLLVTFMALGLVFVIELARIPLSGRFLDYTNLQTWLLLHATYLQAGLSILLVVSLWIGRIRNLKVYAASTWLLVVLIYNFTVYGATAIRSQIKDFPAIAANITKLIGDNKLTVVRTERQEFFDPVLFYLPKEAERIEPDSLESLDGKTSESGAACAGYLLARKPWFDNFRTSDSDIARSIFDIHEFYSWIDQQRVNLQNGMVIFRCRDKKNA